MEDHPFHWFSDTKSEQSRSAAGLAARTLILIKLKCQNWYWDQWSLPACRIEFNPISVNIMEFEREFIIKEAARANVTTLVNNHRSRIKNVTGGSVAEMRLMVNVGSFVITIIMPRLVSACQRMAESVTLWPGVNSYEGVTHHTGDSLGRVWWRWPELLLLSLGTMRLDAEWQLPAV